MTSIGSSSLVGCLATEQGICRNRILIARGFYRCENSQVELLPEILSGPELSPHVPHPDIVQRNVDGSPRPGINLEWNDHSNRSVSSFRFVLSDGLEFDSFPRQCV